MFNFYLNVFEKVEYTYLLRGGCKTTSPLEKSFLGYWFLRWGENAINNGGVLKNPNMRENDYVRKIIPQHKVLLKGNNFIKIDFAIVCTCASARDIAENQMAREDFEIAYNPNLIPKDFKIAIELDGHNYHERTRTQVTRRDKRDVELQKHKYYIHHISSTKLYNDFSNTILELGDSIINLAANERGNL